MRTETKPPPVYRQTKPCLCCSKAFEAISPFNRLCNDCKAKNRAYYGPLVDYAISAENCRDGLVKRQRQVWEDEKC